MFGLLGSTSTFAYQPVGIDAATLQGVFQARSALAAAQAGGARLSGAAAQALSGQTATGDGVLAPWEPGSGALNADELKQKALATGDFIDADDLGRFSDIQAPEDQKKLFALHQALKKLWAIAGEAAGKTTTDMRRGFLDRRFQEGLTQVQDFMATATFTDLSLTFAKLRETAEAANVIPRGEDVFKTGVLHDGAFDAEVDGFLGDRRFSLSVRKSNETVVVNIDLADMGATPRTLDNVADHINAELSAAGLNTRFKRVEIGTPDDNGVIPGDRFGFKIEGVSIERLTFTAADSTAALVLAGTSGRDTDTAATAGQITRLTDLGQAAPATGLSARVEAAESAETGLAITSAKVDANGFLYALAETDAGLDGGPTLRGDKDLVLIKYDSAGRKVWARTLGAAGEATGAKLAVTAAGEVVVAGTVRGALGDSIDRGGADAFVAKYAANGSEIFLSRFGGALDEHADAVTVAADGTVYVAGRTATSLNGTAHGGGDDAYVRAFDAAGAALWTRQFGGGDQERATALAVADDGGLLVASVENGDGFLRKFSSADGSSAALWEHAFGTLDQGTISGLAVDGTSIYVAGAARSGLALAGPVVAHAGARDAFLARFEDGASPSQTFATFLGSDAEDVATDIAVAGGAVYLSGRTDGALPGGGGLAGTRDAFAAKFDAASGALAWTQQISGRDGRSTAAALALDPGHSATLKAFGLPRGEIVYQDSRNVVDRTAARAGDYFYVRVDGGAKRKVSISAGDSLRALTFKINAALLLDGDASVKRASGGDVLRIAPKPGVSVELIAGDAGRDLLAALGLAPGRIEKPAKADPDGDAEEALRYGLELTGTLRVGAKSAAAVAVDALGKAMTTLREAYRDLTHDPALKELLKSGAKTTGQAPAYMTAKIANYQEALARLGGGF